MSDETPKRMSAKEFRELGYLQELNRRFLHPLGLGLEIVQEKDGTERFGGVWDYREDPEGLLYGLKDEADQSRLDRFKRNAGFIDSEIEWRTKMRQGMLGYGIEPIP